MKVFAALLLPLAGVSFIFGASESQRFLRFKLRQKSSGEFMAEDLGEEDILI